MAVALERKLQLAFTKRLVSTAEGRAHLLAQVADAESSGESVIFERALAQVSDPELQQLIKKHRADELRHEALFRGRLARTGIDATTPPELRMIDRLDSAVGGLLSRPIEDARGVMEAYLLLQVIEERAVSQFPLIIAALQPVDEGSATTFQAVLADEERHLKYCQAIARRYAPSDEERERVLLRFRTAEADAFRENQLANATYVLARGFMGGPLASLPWRIALAIGKRRAPKLTEFARPPIHAAA